MPKASGGQITSFFKTKDDKPQPKVADQDRKRKARELEMVEALKKEVERDKAERKAMASGKEVHAFFKPVIASPSAAPAVAVVKSQITADDSVAPYMTLHSGHIASFTPSELALLSACCAVNVDIDAPLRFAVIPTTPVEHNSVAKSSARKVVSTAAPTITILEESDSDESPPVRVSSTDGAPQLLWADKYQPQKAAAVCGNSAAVRAIDNWLRDWRAPPPKDYQSDSEESGSEDMSANAMLVSGPIGSGKTASIYACARERGFRVLELNAGCFRSRKAILELFGEATQSHQVSNFHTVAKAAAEALKPKQKKPTKKKPVKRARKVSSDDEDDSREPIVKVPEVAEQTMLLFEEVDTTFEEDKGFMGAIVSLMHSSRRPIILTCNDLPAQFQINDDRHVMNRSNNVLMLHTAFSRPVASQECEALQAIAKAESVSISIAETNTLVQLLRHDIRRAIHEMQFWSRGHLAHPALLSRVLQAEVPDRLLLADLAFLLERLTAVSTVFDGPQQRLTQQVIVQLAPFRFDSPRNALLALDPPSAISQDSFASFQAAPTFRKNKKTVKRLRIEVEPLDDEDGSAASTVPQDDTEATAEVTDLTQSQTATECQQPELEDSASAEATAADDCGAPDESQKLQQTEQSAPEIEQCAGDCEADAHATTVSANESSDADDAHADMKADMNAGVNADAVADTDLCMDADVDVGGTPPAQPQPIPIVDEIPSEPVPTEVSRTRRRVVNAAAAFTEDLSSMAMIQHQVGALDEEAWFGHDAISSYAQQLSRRLFDNRIQRITEQSTASSVDVSDGAAEDEYIVRMHTVPFTSSQQQRRVVSCASAVRPLVRALHRDTQWEYAGCMETICAVEAIKAELQPKRRRGTLRTLARCDLHDAQMDHLASMSLLSKV